MTGRHLQEQHLDFYLQNSDWEGRIVENFHETVRFQKDSSIRIWFNEQTQGFAAHWHNALEIIMPLENHYDVETRNQFYHLQPGEILIIPAGEMHTLHAPQSGNRLIFQFDTAVLSHIKGQTSIQTLFKSSLCITEHDHPQIYPDIYQLLLQIRNEYFGFAQLRELAIYSYLLKLLVILGRDQASEGNRFPNTRIYKQREYVQKFKNVLTYIDEHYTENLSLETIAAYSGFSKYHFSRLFKQYTDATYYDYLNHRRLKAAEILLAQPDLSVTEIALQSGFASISTFNRIFRQKKGCTPSEYRSSYITY